MTNETTYNKNTFIKGLAYFLGGVSTAFVLGVFTGSTISLFF